MLIQVVHRRTSGLLASIFQEVCSLLCLAIFALCLGQSEPVLLSLLTSGALKFFKCNWSRNLCLRFFLNKKMQNGLKK